MPSKEFYQDLLRAYRFFRRTIVISKRRKIPVQDSIELMYGGDGRITNPPDKAIKVTDVRLVKGGKGIEVKGEMYDLEGKKVGGDEWRKLNFSNTESLCEQIKAAGEENEETLEEEGVDVWA